MGKDVQYLVTVAAHSSDSSGTPSLLLMRRSVDMFGALCPFIHRDTWNLSVPNLRARSDWLMLFAAMYAFSAFIPEA